MKRLNRVIKTSHHQSLDNIPINEVARSTKLRSIFWVLYPVALLITFGLALLIALVTAPLITFLVMVETIYA